MIPDAAETGVTWWSGPRITQADMDAASPHGLPIGREARRKHNARDNQYRAGNKRAWRRSAPEFVPERARSYVEVAATRVCDALGERRYQLYEHMLRMPSYPVVYFSRTGMIAGSRGPKVLRTRCLRQVGRDLQIMTKAGFIGEGQWRSRTEIGKPRGSTGVYLREVFGWVRRKRKTAIERRTVFLPPHVAKWVEDELARRKTFRRGGARPGAGRPRNALQSVNPEINNYSHRIQRTAVRSHEDMGGSIPIGMEVSIRAEGASDSPDQKTEESVPSVPIASSDGARPTALAIPKGGVEPPDSTGACGAFPVAPSSATSAKRPRRRAPKGGGDGGVRDDGTSGARSRLSSDEIVAAFKDVFEGTSPDAPPRRPGTWEYPGVPRPPTLGWLPCATMPGPPPLASVCATPETRPAYLARTYASAVIAKCGRSRAGRAAAKRAIWWNPDRGVPKKLEPTLAEAAALLVEHQITPAAWVEWSWLLWNADEKRRGTVPSLGYVFSAKRLASNKLVHWFRQEGPVLGGELLDGPARKDMRARHEAMRTELRSLVAPRDEEVKAIVDKHFPDGLYDVLAEQERQHAVETEADLRRKTRSGGWPWR